MRDHVGVRMAAVVCAVLLGCAGCATARQSTAELSAGLAWFPPAEGSPPWPPAIEGDVRLERAPIVVVAWAPVPAPEGQTPLGVSTRRDREAWIAAIESKLDRSGWVARAEPSPPDTFEGGVTVADLRTLGADRQADVIVLFGMTVAERRYHVSWPTLPVYVVDVIEVRTIGRAVGVTPAGRPLFTETQTGFDERPTQFEAEVREASRRAAVSALADAVVRRFQEIGPKGGAR